MARLIPQLIQRPNLTYENIKRVASDTEIINAQTEFGAIGNNDDYAGIQAALTAAGNISGGAAVYLPPTAYGGYYLTNHLAVPSNVRVFGDGPASTINVVANLPGGVTRGAFECTGTSQIDIDSLRFNMTGCNNPAIMLSGTSTVKIRNCYFTGNTTGDAVVDVTTRNFAGNMAQTWITDCHFINCTGTYPIQIETNVARTNQEILVQGCRFEQVKGTAIKVTAGSGLVRNLRILGNAFIDIIGETSPASPAQQASALHAGLDAVDQVESILFAGNFYRESDPATTGKTKIPLCTYGLRGLNVIGNVFIDTTVSSDSTCWAPGRTTGPISEVQFVGNYVEGFGSFWDPDSMRRVVVADNTVKNCNLNGGLGIGYGIQEYVQIVNNVFYNCFNTAEPAAITIGNVSPAAKKCLIADNLIIDDGATATITRAIETTGGGVFDSSDVIVRNNRIYVPNGTITTANELYKQNASNLPPDVIENLEIHDSTGKRTRNWRSTTYWGEVVPGEYELAAGYSYEIPDGSSLEIA